MSPPQRSFHKIKLAFSLWVLFKVINVLTRCSKKPAKISRGFFSQIQTYPTNCSYTCKIRETVSFVYVVTIPDLIDIKWVRICTWSKGAIRCWSREKASVQRLNKWKKKKRAYQSDLAATKFGFLECFVTYLQTCWGNAKLAGSFRPGMTSTETPAAIYKTVHKQKKQEFQFSSQ